MSEPNIRKMKLPDPSYIKMQQPKKEYNLRSKLNNKTLIVSEMSHSGERVQRTMNEERPLFDQNKNSSAFTIPNDPDLIANGGYIMLIVNRSAYDHQDVISIVDVGVIERITKGVGSVDQMVVIKDIIFMVMVATSIVIASAKIIRATLIHTSQNQTNSLERMV